MINNLWSTMRGTLAVLPPMAEQGYGRSINVGTESVRNGLVDHAVYNTTKGGVHGLTSGLARDHAAFVTGQVLSINGGSSMG